MIATGRHLACLASVGLLFACALVQPARGQTGHAASETATPADSSPAATSRKAMKGVDFQNPISLLRQVEALPLREAAGRILEGETAGAAHGRKSRNDKWKCQRKKR